MTFPSLLIFLHFIENFADKNEFSCCYIHIFNKYYTSWNSSNYLKKFSGQQPLDSHRGQMWPYLIYLQNYTFRESHP